MWGAQTLSNLAEIVSGPVALLGSRDGRTSRTSVDYTKYMGHYSLFFLKPDPICCDFFRKQFCGA